MPRHTQHAQRHRRPHRTTKPCDGVGFCFAGCPSSFGLNSISVSSYGANPRCKCRLSHTQKRAFASSWASARSGWYAEFGLSRLLATHPAFRPHRPAWIRSAEVGWAMSALRLLWLAFLLLLLLLPCVLVQGVLVVFTCHLLS